MTGDHIPVGDDTASANERFQLIAKSTNDIFWDWNLETNEIWRNERFDKLFGNAEAPTGPESWASLIHPDDRERVSRRVQEVIDQGTELAEEYRLRRPNGTYAQVFDRAFAVRHNGRTVRMVGSLMDISEQFRLQQALRNVERRFQNAFDNASVGIVISDPDGGFLQVNRAFCQMTGYSPDELYRQTYEQLVHPDDLPRYQKKLDGLLKGKSGSLVDQKRCLHKDGRTVWLSINSTVNQDEYGRPETIFSIIQDITQDMALRESQQKMLSMVESSLTFMAIADLDGRVAYINKAGRELVGMEEDEPLAGKMVADFYSPEQFAFIRDVAIPTLLSQGSWAGRVMLRHFKTGEPIPCHASGIRINDPTTGKAIGRGFTMRDLRPELSAQEAQQKLLALVENSVELMSVLELDGRNSYINKAGRQMLGFDSDEEVLATPITSLHSPEDFSLVREQVLPSVMNTGRWSGVMRVRHLKTGEHFPLYNNTIRIDDPATGQPIAIGAVMRDMRPEMANQRALLESEARFRNMIVQAPVAIGMLRGEDLVIVEANRYILELWGKGVEIIGKPLLAALPEIKGQGFIELLEGVYASGEAYYGYEVLAQLERSKGLEDCYFNFVYAPIRESDGTISGIIVVATEVTPQVKAKKELEESEKRFRNLVLGAPMATAVYAGPDMVIQLANEAMLKLWGKDASVIGKKLHDALPELEGQPFHQLLTDVYTSGVAYQAKEDRADLVVDGKLQTFYFNFTYKPLRDADGKVYAILNMALDITYQVNAKQQLRETEESLREAVDLAELATWTINPATAEMTSSDRVRDWLGVDGPLPPELIVGCVHEKDRPEFERITQAALDPASGGHMDLEYTVINQRTGQEHILHTQARVLFDENGSPYLIRGTSQEITAQRMTEQELEKQVQVRTEELKKSNQQLQQSNQELERYAYVASHDLQEPLRKIQIYSGLLAERFRKDVSEEGLYYLNKVEESANRMSVLIKNILDFSRTSHQMQLLEEVDLNEVVESVQKDLEMALSQKNARVEVERLCRLEAVPVQMRQLFYNLIGNALKFAREEVRPEIVIRSRELTEAEVRRYEKLNPRLRHCEITVSDNGIGFNPAFADKIFGLFQRLHPQQQYQGTGIGLALCQRIVVNHQGELWAESEEGKGATFHLVLPLTRA
ncbi:PAS domain S-box protein [Tellurirhabdus rosea]|uniref:PAS domain S-box protein n=1 Tax=Tellurirhabdus rosea TaxID=2674997 RepID=UPI00225C1C8E|nr:PAS domain S-box protein [Tellurirhabdus rosea]